MGSALFALKGNKASPSISRSKGKRDRPKGEDKMKSLKEVQEAKKKVLQAVQVAERPTYYKGMLQALNWVLGQRELLTAQDAENIERSIAHIMKNKL